MKIERLFRKVGFDYKRFRRGIFDSGYDYLINEYIPKQGNTDMLAFIDLGFSPMVYLLWKLDVNGLLKDPFAIAFRNKIKLEFGCYPSKE